MSRSPDWDTPPRRRLVVECDHDVACRFGRLARLRGQTISAALRQAIKGELDRADAEEASP